MRNLLAALIVLLAFASSAQAVDTFSTDTATPKRATVNGTAFFPLIFYDSGAATNFADTSVQALDLGRFGMTHYLNYQYGPQPKAIDQLSPLAALGKWGFATGNAFGGSDVDTMSAGNNTFAVVANTLVNGQPFRSVFPGTAGAGGAYLADEPCANAVVAPNNGTCPSVSANVFSYRTTYHTDMPTMPVLFVLLPEGPLVPETSAGSGIEQWNSSVGFVEHTQSVANPYWWMRQNPGGNDWFGEDPYPIFKDETNPTTGVGGQGGYPNFWVADRVAHTVAAASQNGKVPGVILQLFGSFGGGRFPTVFEQWQHTVMALAEGARWIGWWQIGNSNGLRQQPDNIRLPAEQTLIDITNFIHSNEATLLSTPIVGRLTNSTQSGTALNWRKAILPTMAAAIQQTNFLAGGRGSYQAELNALNASTTTWSPMLDQNGDVRQRVFRIGSTNQYLVFAYNYHPATRNNVVFTFDTPVSTVTVLGNEARSITPSGNTWTDSFGGSSSANQLLTRSAHIYQVTLASTPPAFVTGSNACGVGLTTPAVTTTGATLIVVGVTSATNPNPTVTDSKGNTWTKTSQSPLTISDSTSIFYAVPSGAQAGTNHTFTIATGGSGVDTICVAAFSGLTAPVLDQQAKATTPAPTSNFNSGAAPTTTAADELLIGFSQLSTGTPYTCAPGSGYTLAAFNGAANTGSTGCLEYRIVSAVGAYSAGFTTGAVTGTGGAMIATFKSSGAPDTTPPTDPSSLACTGVTSATYSCSWVASTDANPVTYNLEVSSGSTCASFSEIAAGIVGTSTTTTGFAAGGTRCFRLRAFDGTNFSTNYTNTQTVATLAAQTLRLHWTDLSNDETAFAVFLCQPAYPATTCDPTVTTAAATVGVGTVDYTTTTAPAPTVCASVNAQKTGAADSGFLTTRCFTSSVGTNTPPNAPSNLRMTGNLAINVAWLDLSTDETSFELETRAGCGSGTFTLAATLSANVTSTILSLPGISLVEGRLRAVNANGPSGYTNTTCWSRWGHSTAGLQAVPPAHGTDLAPPPHGSLP